jgi:hypothetical protein
MENTRDAFFIVIYLLNMEMDGVKHRVDDDLELVYMQ